MYFKYYIYIFIIDQVFDAYNGAVRILFLVLTPISGTAFLLSWFLQTVRIPIKKLGRASVYDSSAVM